MGQLRDLSNQVLVDKVKQTMDQANIDKTNIDAVCDRLMIRPFPFEGGTGQRTRSFLPREDGWEAFVFSAGERTGGVQG